MKDYEINEDTLAIIPKEYKKTIVYEKNNKYVIEENVNKIMEDSCLYFGSTLKGRQIGSTSLLNITHKVPILIEETSEIIFFPTSSPRLKECSWISLNNIKSYDRDKNGSKITFNDGSIVNLPISYGMLNNQILRSSRLQYMINQRKAQKKDKKAKK